MVARVVAYIVGACVATITVAQIFQGGLVTYDTVSALLVFGLLLGLLDACIKPALQAITWPTSCLTFGVLAIVSNVALYGISAAVVPGIDATIWGVLLGGIVTATVSGVVFALLDEI